MIECYWSINDITTIIKDKFDNKFNKDEIEEILSEFKTKYRDDIVDRLSEVGWEMIMDGIDEVVKDRDKK
jgi:hypothetical protein